MIDALLTPDEVARILGLSPFTVRRLLRQGDLPGRKVGKRQWRIRRADLEEYLGASSTSGNSSTSVLSLQIPQPPQPRRRQHAQEIDARIARLAAEQGVLPVADFDRLLGDAWLEGDEHPEHTENNEEGAGESADDFLAPIRKSRESSPARSAL